MNYGILTFAFAHNYGALLQATALKDYVLKSGNTCRIVPYAPLEIEAIYTINPIVPYISPKNTLSRFLKLRKRINSYRAFEKYKNIMYDGQTEIHDQKGLVDNINTIDVLLLGSDQIWNTNIIHNDISYFMPNSFWPGKKIAYAASFGKKQIDEFQRNAIITYIKDFNSISLREEDGADDIYRIIGKRPKIVLDPVFLQEKAYWQLKCKKPKKIKEEKYILFYSLSNDKDLVRKAEEFSKNLCMPIVAIHPTGSFCHMKAVFIDGVGPEEFLWLVFNASLVVTDSFHATAFSVIFEKKYFHLIRAEKESRIESLLFRIGAYHYCDIQNGLLDFKLLDRSLLDTEINNSCVFLNNILS